MNNNKMTSNTENSFIISQKKITRKIVNYPKFQTGKSYQNPFRLI